METSVTHCTNRGLVGSAKTELVEEFNGLFGGELDLSIRKLEAGLKRLSLGLRRSLCSRLCRFICVGVSSSYHMVTKEKGTNTGYVPN